MSAQYLTTPVGLIPIRASVITEMSTMSDRQVADKCFADGFICPEAFAELEHRDLVMPGTHEADTYELITLRELAKQKDQAQFIADLEHCIELGDIQYQWGKFLAAKAAKDHSMALFWRGYLSGYLEAVRYQYRGTAMADEIITLSKLLSTL